VRVKAASEQSEASTSPLGVREFSPSVLPIPHYFRIPKSEFVPNSELRIPNSELPPISA
jgi:hypothetical protein